MKKNDSFNPDFYDIYPRFPVDRREFLKLVGGGIFVFFAVGDTSALQEQKQRRSVQTESPADFNAYLRIGENGRVTCFSGKIEMGQGVITSLAQMLAEELNISLESVDMVMGDTDICPWDMGTFGSMSTRFFGPSLRGAAAEAKGVLLQLAAEYLHVPEKQLMASNGTIFDKSDKKKLVTYADLAKGKRIERHLTEKPALKPVSQFSVIGQEILRRDAHEKVTGEAKFAGDIHLPGMLCARILRPPAHGAVMKNVDTSGAEKIEGLQIVRDNGLIAVLHEHPDVAQKALERIKADFDIPESKVDDKTIFDHLLMVAPEGEEAASGGLLQRGEKQATKIFEKTYLNSYVAHAPIETHTAVAQVEKDRATVWASTQTPFRLKEELAEVLGFLPQNIHVLTPFVGGGFGGKSQNSQAVEAARLAKLTGKPVQVAWSREEEFFYDTFRPAAVVKIKSGLNEEGKIVLWDYHVYFAGERGSPQFYDIPHHRTLVHGSGWRGSPESHPFGTGAWRAPANNTNTFARESQMDIMASAAGLDPLEFRLKNLKDERMKRVLRAAADKFGWSPAKAPSGRGFGVACGMDAGTYVAVMAEAGVNKVKGKIQVKRLVCAQDMGVVINPEGARLQMEGCLTMGLGYALSEEIHFKGGRILDLNFDSYEIPRFSWLPQIETVLVENKDLTPQGGGEPAIISMGGVIANAVFDSSGARVLQLPMTPERVLSALKK